MKLPDDSRKRPHVHFDIDGKELDGRVTNWEQELASPNLLLSPGLASPPKAT